MSSEKMPTKFPDLNEIDDDFGRPGRGSDRHHDSLEARKEARRRMRAAMPQLPDLRFEQSYLSSIKNHIRPRSSPAQPTLPYEEKTDELSISSAKVLTVSYWAQELEVDWLNVAWVTVKDQFLSPFYFGIGWKVLSTALGASTALLRASLYSHTPYPNQHFASKSTSATDSTASRGVGQLAADWWRRLVDIITPVTSSVRETNTA